MKRVQILLSAYNGEKYLPEQLDSLLNQKNVDLHILIRDDGSKDGTKSILRDYEECGNIRIIYSENRGVQQSFLELIKASDSECDYFAFCDQDDFWLPEKLSRAIELLEREAQGIPLLYSSCLEIVDEQLRPISYWQKPRKALSFYNAMIENVMPGNTQVFNRQLRDLLARPENARYIVMHDHFAYLTGCAFGKAVFDEAANIKYRQHGQNEVGMKKSIMRITKERFKKVLSKGTVKTSLQIRFFLEQYGELLKNEYRQEAERFLEGRSFIKRLKYICGKKAYYQGAAGGFVFWMLYLFGFYKIDKAVV